MKEYQLKINGNDLISMGFKGKEIGKIHNTVLDLVIKEKIKKVILVI